MRSQGHTIFLLYGNAVSYKEKNSAAVHSAALFIRRVTGIIRTRPKTVLFKSFRRFTLERRQPSCGLNPKNPIKITRFQVEDFLQDGFLVRQGTKHRKSSADFRAF